MNNEVGGVDTQVLVVHPAAKTRWLIALEVLMVPPPPPKLCPDELRNDVTPLNDTGKAEQKPGAPLLHERVSVCAPGVGFSKLHKSIRAEVFTCVMSWVSGCAPQVMARPVGVAPPNASTTTKAFPAPIVSDVFVIGPAPLTPKTVPTASRVTSVGGGEMKKPPRLLIVMISRGIRLLVLSIRPHPCGRRLGS